MPSFDSVRACALGKTISTLAAGTAAASVAYYLMASVPYGAAMLAVLPAATLAFALVRNSRWFVSLGGEYTVNICWVQRLLSSHARRGMSTISWKSILRARYSPITSWASSCPFSRR